MKNIIMIVLNKDDYSYMTLYKTIRKKEIVYVVDKDIVDDDFILDIISKSPKNKRIGLDMKNVQSVKSKKLITYLLDNKIKLFNLQSEVLAYLALILKDGFLKSYVNYFDFKDDKRELIKRRFLVA